GIVLGFLVSGQSSSSSDYCGDQVGRGRNEIPGIDRATRECCLELGEGNEEGYDAFSRYAVDRQIHLANADHFCSRGDIKQSYHKGGISRGKKNRSMAVIGQRLR